MDRKILVVYYSRSGTTQKAAELIAAELKCDCEAIQDVRSRKGIFGWLRSGREAMRRQLPQIRPTTRDPGAYDLVILGTPVWASAMSSPLRTYISQNQGKFRDVAYLIVCGGEGDDRPSLGLTELIGKPPKAVLTLRDQTVRKGDFAPAVKAFVARL